MATHTSILAWKILWTEEPGGLLFMGSHRVRHDWSDLACMHALEEEMATHSNILAWRIPGTQEPGGLPSMGSHRVGHDWSSLAAAAAVRLWSGALCCPLLTEKGKIKPLADKNRAKKPVLSLGKKSSKNSLVLRLTESSEKWVRLSDSSEPLFLV